MAINKEHLGSRWKILPDAETATIFPCLNSDADENFDSANFILVGGATFRDATDRDDSIFAEVEFEAERLVITVYPDSFDRVYELVPGDKIVRDSDETEWIIKTVKKVRIKTAYRCACTQAFELGD